MPNDHRWAGAHASRAAGRPRRRVRRAWRRRSRRAQVSAVATILGLLLVVTFIANYLSTTLPNQMSQNDIQHETLVENQVSELSILLQAIASNQEVGAQVAQAVSLGTAGAPPFANADPGALTPGNLSASLKLNFTLVGPGGKVLQIPGSAATPVGSFVVQLRNTYAPPAEVAFEQGAVILAEPGSLPIFSVPPRISFSGNALSLFLPRFANTVGSEAGSGTADVSLRLLAVAPVSLPTPAFAFQSGSRVTVTVVTPYAVTWYNYFETNSAFSSYVSCTGSNNVCTALYTTSGTLGTVTLSIPTAGLSLNVLTALYAVNVL